MESVLMVKYKYKYKYKYGIHQPNISLERVLTQTVNTEG